MAEPYSKFGFDNEFFELDVAGGFSTLQARAGVIEQTRTEAYAAGLNDGKAMAAAEVAEMQRHCAAMTEKFTAAQNEWVERSTRQLLNLWFASLNHLLGHAAQHYPEQILEQHLKSLMPLLHSGDELTLRIHPSARQFHEKLGLAHAHINGHNFRIIDDVSLMPGDCVVEWQGGGLEAKLHDHQKLIAELLESAGAPVEAPAAPTPPEVSATPAPQVTPVRTRAAELLGDDDIIDALK